MWRVVASAADESQRSWSVPPGVTLTLGSTPESDLVLTWSGVSRHHAFVYLRDGALWIEDRRSKNRLRFGGEPVDRVRLAPGEVVQIGGGFLRLEQVETSDAEPAPEVELASRAPAAEPERTGTGAESSPIPAAAVSWLAGLVGTATTANGFSQLLSEARNLLGAQALFTVRVGRHREPVLLLAAGEPDLEGLDTREGATSNLSFCQVALDAETRLIASFPAGSAHPAWKHDLVQALARCTGSTPRPLAPRPTAGSLPFGPDMAGGVSPRMEAVHEKVRRLAPGDLPILLVGETGVGKERYAQLIHDLARPSGPFEAVNCAAIPADLLESQLFGHVRGAFTGAHRDRPGHFQRASGGTLFLDEVGDLPLSLQPKLLRAIAEKEVRPVGAEHSVPVAIRLISATHHDLAKAVTEGWFRSDLYYRLVGAEIALPPLRERLEDLPELLTAFVEAASARSRRAVAGISRRALRLLRQHPWPGNLRELKNVVERAVALAPDGAVLESRHFELPPSPAPGPAATRPLDDGLPLRLRDLERWAVQRALAEADGRVTRAAKLLGICRQTLSQKLDRYGLRPRSDRAR